MKRNTVYRSKFFVLAPMLLLGISVVSKEAIAQQYPLKVSPNQRYLVDQDNVPFFMHSDTLWGLFLKLSLSDVGTYLENRISWFEAPADVRARPWREHVVADPIEAVVHSLVAADFDCDGQPDLFGANWSGPGQTI